MHVIGEETSERLDVIPAQFRVIVTHRPKYACRACEEAPVQAPAPERLIKGGLPTEAMVAYVLAAKYAWHLPLYRQAQILLSQGVAIERATLTQMCPAEGERDGFAEICCVGNVLVGRVSIALHDAMIGIEQLQRVDGAAARRIGVGDGGRVGSTPGPVIAGDRPEVFPSWCVPGRDRAPAPPSHRRRS